ncbi:PilZ domain-containing protein [Sphingomonas baiyangensis]|uniref:PilZ domain-containing protein n=1 Tax=Sphingomonas baiyangensis TaxID=2572576 RepID=A0A4U1L2K0_9SPHN|nr:PilZ domain-containing protein [Sphingomonas baiyangensis]TKD51079.1 PilZ domain-containing protein [Sphingomonas baiyangensis]
MAYAGGSLAFVEQRESNRDLVHFRARGFGGDARSLSLLIVNISPHGLMARCEGEHEAGERLRITLPVVGVAAAEIRWALGGRLGCSFDVPIDRASYYELLATMIQR